MRVLYSELNPEARPFTLNSVGGDADDGSLAAKRSGRYSVNRLDFDSLEGEPHDVASFLRFLRLHKYIDSINQQRITLVQLLNMSEQDLIQIGFTANGARKRLVTGISRYHEYLAREWMSPLSDDGSSTDSSVPSSPELVANDEDADWGPTVYGSGSSLSVRSMPVLSRRQTCPGLRVSPMLNRRLSAFVNLGLPEVVECELDKQYFGSRRPTMCADVDEQAGEDDGYLQLELSGILQFMEAADE